MVQLGGVLTKLISNLIKIKTNLKLLHLLQTQLNIELNQFLQ